MTPEPRLIVIGGLVQPRLQRSDPFGQAPFNKVLIRQRPIALQLFG